MVQTLRSTILLTGAIFTVSPAVYGETQACAEGKRIACIGYGDQIVKSNAVCFDPLKCGHEGFVCKSELNSMADDYDGLVGAHNDLVSQYNELVSTYESTVSAYDRFVRCVSAASTLEEADSCEPES